ncbi:MAG TPA: GntR family transcriptional regulator [Spirochaetota bacterium]|nr:GntR family transcriptional regulator [Spirochaetota bacterium]
MNRIRLDNTHIPLHYQIADYLEDMLKRGEMEPDVQVPPEEELTQAFGVSRTTVRRSMEHLLAKGLLTRKRGKGTFWTDSAKEIKREKLFGVNKQIFNISEKTTVRVLSKTSGKGNKDVYEFLGVQDGNDLIIFRRVRYTGGNPMSYTINFLPEKYGTLIKKQHLLQMTMLETIEKVAGVRIGTIEHEVEITRASDVIAEYLGIPVLDPVLTIKTSVFEKNGSPVEIVWTYFVENKYKFRVVLD